MKNLNKPLIGLTLQGLRDVAAEASLPPFAAKQMAAWLYQRRVFDIDAMTDLSKKGRQALAVDYTPGIHPPKESAVSADGTIKYLFDGVGSRDIESVFIPDHDRATLCVSSQAGCKMNCSFCMTGRQGFNGNLSPADIINQVLAIPESHRLTNLVFMGMGEPMDNLQPVLTAIDILTAPWGLAWSPKRITVSSIGKIKELRQLLDLTKVHIAISLHNPFPAERAAIMPVERAYPIRNVIDLLSKYDFSHQRRLSFEYIMWDGINDSPRYSTELARLISNLDCRVNLIRFHAIPGSNLNPSTTHTMERFRDALNAAGITATIRASRGEDIMAACGMLAGKNRPQNHD
jgi:23S rRNA (adenine2503-C2)-methyltransferase